MVSNGKRKPSLGRFYKHTFRIVSNRPAPYYVYMSGYQSQYLDKINYDGGINEAWEEHFQLLEQIGGGSNRMRVFRK